MKKTVIFITAVLALATVSFAARAQEEEIDECLQYMSYYQDYYKQGTKDAKLAALPSWRKAYSICQPGTKSMRQNLYVHGADLYRILISKNAKNPAYRASLIDTLLTLHQLRAQYYPKYAQKAYAALSADVNNYLKNDPDKTYKILSKVIESQGSQATPVTFVASMNAAVTLYKRGDISIDEILSLYDKSTNCFNEIQKVDTTQNTRNLRATMESAFINSKVASCETLQSIFASRFEENKDNVEEVSKIVRMMATAEDCTDNDLFLNAVTQMHKLEPSSNSAYYLFRLNASRKNIQEALKYIDEALAGEDLDAATQAQYSYEAATFALKGGLYVKAVDMATKAISLDQSIAGKAYMVIGHAWMSTGCSGNEVERRAKYWVAVDNFSKAKAADASLVEEASKQIGVCAAYFPETAEAFMYDFQNGQSYTVSCGGMRAATTVRTR